MAEQERVPPAEPGAAATQKQLEIARSQGDAFGAAVKEALQFEGHGSTCRAGDYQVSYAVKEVEGFYRYRNGTLEWIEPHDENAHLEVFVADAADGRFVPELHVVVSLADRRGNNLGSALHEFVWHPWVYHYGRNWSIPGDGVYSIKIEIEPPTFVRRDHSNGRRYSEPVTVEFPRVEIQTGRKAA